MSTHTITITPNIWDKPDKYSELSAHDKIIWVRSIKPSKIVGNWSEPAIRILNERYLYKYNGFIDETPDECMWRVAYAAAEAEYTWGSSDKEVYDLAVEFYIMMVNRDFLPNSPTIMNAGTHNGLQLSACFVLSPEDSIISIFDTMKYSAIIAQSGGGIGHGLSNIRAKGSLVAKSQGEASGPVSFLRAMNAASGAMVQGGRRRGANMATLSVHHPDLDEFITCKDANARGAEAITNFNVSVLATNQFMNAVIYKDDFDIIDPQTQKIIGRRSAVEVFDKICESAWNTGDPGVLFIDVANNSGSNPIPVLETLTSTNPCGEVYLGDFDACNLGSINLGNFTDSTTTRLEYTVKLAIRFLDNIIEVNPFPLQQVTDKVKSLRRLGLGVMGWSDYLFKIHTAYHNNEAFNIASFLMETIKTAAIEESEFLAQTRDPFPLFSQSIYSGGTPRRNAQLTVIAPTGSISIIAGCNSGIEPVFALAYEHRVKQAEGVRVLTIANETFINMAKEHKFYSDYLLEYVSQHGVLTGFNETNPLIPIPSWALALFITAMEISFEDHIQMQAAWQLHVDNGVSKSINLPNNATIDDVKCAYMLAYETGCKGITVFRDGCLSTGQVLNIGKQTTSMVPELYTSEETDIPFNLIPLHDSLAIDIHERERPNVVFGYTRQLKAPEGTTNVTINSDANGPLEVFLNIGKAGSDVAALAEALGRMISLNLRVPSSISPIDRFEQIATQLDGIGGSRSIGFGPNKVLSLPDAVAQAIKYHLDNGLSDVNPVLHNDVETGNIPEQSNPQKAVKRIVKPVGNLCPECGSTSFVREEGCTHCLSCGFSMC